jgi:transposase
MHRQQYPDASNPTTGLCTANCAVRAPRCNCYGKEYVEGNPGLPTYRYTQFCQKYKDWAASLKRSMRQQHRAGEKLFADFAGQTVPVLARDGGIAFQSHVFVAVLGASNYTFACATQSERMGDWIGGLCDALEFIGGVPELLVPANPKALIALADRYEPVLGRTAQDFENHYATAMLPARPSACRSSNAGCWPGCAITASIAWPN